MELAEDLLKSPCIVLAEIGDRFEVRLQLSHQPEHFEIACALQFQTAAGAHLVEIAPEVELQKIARRKGRPPGLGRLGPPKAATLQIEPFDEGIEEAHRMLRAHVIIQAFRQKKRLRAIHSNDKGHGFAPYHPAVRMGRVFTQSHNLGTRELRS